LIYPGEIFKFLLYLFLQGEEASKKNQPYLPPEDGFRRFMGGFLTLGSSSFQAFPSFVWDSGFFWNSSPITVAGAVCAFHGLPIPLNLKTQLSKKEKIRF